MTSLRDYAPEVLRMGLVVLFLWFGYAQVSDPNAWIAWVPEWPTELLKFDAYTIVLVNGVFESVLGILLLLGLWTRWVALLLSLHLLIIAYEIGYNDIGVRDFSLAIATLALALWGDNKMSVWSYLRKRTKGAQSLDI